MQKRIETALEYPAKYTWFSYEIIKEDHFIGDPNKHSSGVLQNNCMKRRV